MTEKFVLRDTSQEKPFGITGEGFTGAPGRREETLESLEAPGAGCGPLPQNQPGVCFVAMALTEEFLLGSVHPSFSWRTDTPLLFTSVGSVVESGLGWKGP